LRTTQCVAEDQGRLPCEFGERESARKDP
jgi:hypothetical protein